MVHETGHDDSAIPRPEKVPGCGVLFQHGLVEVPTMAIWY